MRFVILNTDYPDFLAWLYAQNPGLEEKSYDEQMRVRMDSLFGMADFYSSNLRQLGHEAWDVEISNEVMQKQWAREHGIGVEESSSPTPVLRKAVGRAVRWAGRTPLRYLRPLLRPLFGPRHNQPSWLIQVLAAQIKEYKPDVLWNQAMEGIHPDFLREIKPYARILVGQHAAPLPRRKDFGCYDLVVSSLPNFVEYFRRTGLRAEFHRLAFEPRILPCLADRRAKIPVSFVGSLSRDHVSRLELLEYLCSRRELQVWAREARTLPSRSSIRRCYMGDAWGIEMYRTLQSSKITLNHHIGVAGSYANNLRLFEATGVGTLLVTDWKQNLQQMFEPGKEVVVYRSAEECAELIQYYIEHEEERAKIAAAGQARTLRDHTYNVRMQEFIDIVGKYV